MTIVSHFVGLDVHADNIAVAVACGRQEPRSLGVVPNTPRAVYRMLAKLGDPSTMLVCYEAGPTGYGLQRGLQERGVRCIVVAPALVPSRPGERIKTDRRDARKLARFLRSGDLVEIYVPDEQTEAMRDLERAFGDAKKAQKVARQTLGSFLLRHGRRWSGKTNWTQAHLEWIRKQRFEHEASERTLVHYLETLEAANERVTWLKQSMADLVEDWHLAPLVKALQAFRGIRLITAVILAAELGDLRRFDKPTQLMAYLGLVPSEHSSGNTRRQGGITKTGNGHARRVLVESAWSYRFQPKVRPELARRQKGVSEEVKRIAWRAQQRLCGRYKRLRGRNKEANKVVVAIARELVGFIWAAAHEDNLLAA